MGYQVKKSSISTDWLTFTIYSGYWMIEDTNKPDQHGLTAKMDYGGQQGYLDGLNDLDSLDMHDE